MRGRTAVSACILSLLTLCACDSREQKEQTRQNISTSTPEIVSYIKDKYGFEPEISDSYSDGNTGIFGFSSNNCVIYKLKHGDEEFMAYADCRSDVHKFRDNYQSDDIKKAVADRIEKEFPESFVCASVGCGETAETYHEGDDTRPMFDVYFDGSDLSEVLAGDTLNADIFLVSEDLSDVERFDFVKDIAKSCDSYNFRFISCRSEESAERIRTDRELHLLQKGASYPQFAQYVDSFRVISTNEDICIYDELVYDPSVPEDVLSQ